MKHLHLRQAVGVQEDSASFMAAVLVVSGIQPDQLAGYIDASGKSPEGAESISRLAWAKFLHRQCEMGKNMLEKAIKELEAK